MNRAALVLFEGLPPTVIDSQVLAHVRILREETGLDLTVVAVACSRGLFDSSRARLGRARELAGGEVLLVRGFRPALPGSLLANRLVVGRVLSRLGALGFIHARTDYAAAVLGPWGRRRGIPVLWDCRGDSVAELQARLAGRFGPAVRRRVAAQEREILLAARNCSAALFVTEQLRKLRAAMMAEQPSWVIPCLAPEEDFFFDPALRERVRSELGIDPAEPVYIFSGSLVAYQKFDETLGLFGSVLASNQRARLIVLTPELERARAASASLPAGSVICRSAKLSEVNGYLNAADFGLLLRDSTPVNVVAFPTKFAEYALTGLRVVMKEAPPSCVALARELGIHASAASPSTSATCAERARAAGEAAGRLGRRAAIPLYAGIYKSMLLR